MAAVHRSFALALFGVCCVGLLGIITISSRDARPTVLVTQYPQSDLDMIAAMESLNDPKQTQLASAKVAAKEDKPAAHAAHKKLSMPQQYARIMQNLGYFAPWSRQNSWEQRLAINNIRKANTPQALAQKAEMIKKENKRMQAKFGHPDTAKYTGAHETFSAILDPKYQPWANTGPRHAYYQGY
mmetsp:Transcript_25650/g.51359  ORF Transcript_25650/g.51359 Transcript_25650/m.51359 type:complete len:184 (+) Transcript_25650:29-580(+)